MTSKPKKRKKQRHRIEFARISALSLHALGRFTFEFSQLEYSIRFALASCLKLSEDYFDIVTAPYDFAMLCKVAREALRMQWPNKKDDLEQWCKECLQLNEHRVRIMHGTWTIGPSGPTARHVSRNTLQAKDYFGTDVEIDQLSDQAQRLMQRILFFQPRPE